MNFQPLGDRVVVVRKQGDDQTSSGLYIPPAAKETPQEGTIRAVGPGRTTNTGELIPLTVQVDDTVIFSKYGGTEIEIEGESVLILKESDILGIVKS